MDKCSVSSSGSRFKDKGCGCRVQGLGFRV